MKRGMMSLVALAMCAAPLAAQGDANAGRYGWLSSLESGKVQARDTGKPLMVVIRCVP